MKAGCGRSPIRKDILSIALLLLVLLPAFFISKHVMTASSGPRVEAAATPEGAPACGKRLTRDKQVLESFCLSKELTPFWYAPLLEREAQKPPIDESLAGVRVGPQRVPKVGSCDAVGPTSPRTGPVSESQTKGSPLEVSPTYLPSGTEKLWILAGECGGVLASVEVQYFVPADVPAGRFGGHLNIYRFRGEPEFTLTHSAERVSVGEVKGRPAVLASPITDDGFGDSAVIVREDFGLTVIRASGITMDEVLKIAEGLY
jgi:hypothetical protein